MGEKKIIRYPVKIGYDDGSGKDENRITDAEDKVLVGGWGDCCKVGGIQSRNVAIAIIKVLNEQKPRIFLETRGE